MLLIRATGPARPSEVWRRYASPQRWREWSPQIRGVRGASGRVRPGATGEVLGPLGLRVPFTVTRVDTRGRTWAWRVHALILDIDMEHGVDRADAGSSAWARIHLPAALALPYAPLAWWALKRLVRP